MFQQAMFDYQRADHVLSGSSQELDTGVIPGLVNVNKKLWEDPPFLMGKLTISMAIFNNYVKWPEGKCYFRPQLN